MNRILHVITTFNRGGAENHLSSLAKRQADSGMDVRVAYLKGDGYWGDRLGAQGVAVERMPMRRYGDPRPVMRLRAILEEWKPDVVHAHLAPAELYARLALIGSPGRGVALIISKHNDEPFYRGPCEGFVARRVAARADRIVCISEAVHAFMKDRRLTRDARRMEVVRYGLDESPYLPDRAAEVAALRGSWGGPREFIIGTVSRLVPQKALHVMLEAYALYRRSTRVPGKLVLVGTGPLESELKALAGRLGMAENVVWAGFREDIVDVMKSLDLFALSSIYEGFGLVLLEAMAARRPIVATRVSAIPEVVEDGRTGMLVPPNDPQAMADAFRRFEGRQAREDAGAGGFARLRSEFAIGTMVERISSVYERCLRERRGGSAAPLRRAPETPKGRA